MDTATDSSVDMAALRSLLVQVESMILIQEGKRTAVLLEADRSVISKALRDGRVAILNGEIAVLSDIAAQLRAAGVA